MSERDSVLDIQDHGTVRVLRLNRPRVHNAIDNELLDALASALARAQSDDTRAIVLTGTGRTFCAGSDLGDAADTRSGTAETRIRKMHQIITTLYEYPKPTVAALNGHALGGGLELAIACDLRISVAHARLGLPEITIGLIPSYGGSALLPRIIGEPRALEMMISGVPMLASTARDWGLVNRTETDPDRVLAEAVIMAESCGRHSMVPHRAIKRLLRPARPHRSLHDALVAEREEAVLISSTRDAREGISAFLEKRSPRFEDR